MKDTESTNRSWIAGLMEHRVALGIAILASILLIVFMLRPLGDRYKKAEKNSHIVMPATNQPSSGQAGNQPPQYSIPDKPVSQPMLASKPTAVPAKPSALPKKPVSTTSSATQVTKAAAHGYFVQVGSYRDLANARKQAAQLMRKGWNSSITTNAAGLHTVRIGPVPTHAAAEVLRQKLIDKAKLKGFVVEG